MKAAPAPPAVTAGSSRFRPDEFLDTWDAKNVPQQHDLKSAIIQAFSLNATDDYVYHAIASVTLGQVQAAIDHGAANGMHAWYRDEAGDQVTRISWGFLSVGANF